jgi:poly-gamma-glutamate capsule biosynthesis protein CapA/YwtB (metallophosphatase superfamily)
MAGAGSGPGTDGTLTIFLCGDVMLGRGVDQILRYPGDPSLRERQIRDARVYIELAESLNGAIARPVDWTWLWGDALDLLDATQCQARVVNLETSITTSSDFARGKGVHYRMNPANLPALTVVRPDVCVLANNHVLDFGDRGLHETLEVLSSAGLRIAGAGRFADEAEAAAVVPIPSSAGRLIIVAFGTPSSGIPLSWAATSDKAGVNLLSRLSDAQADQLCDQAGSVRRPGDVVIASAHWGSNWGYEVELDQVRFAHRLIDGGFDLVHGHSSHHPRPLEVYRGKLIMYGCGDLIDDYEGIRGYEKYRDDLRLLYLARVDQASGQLLDLRMAPLQARQLRLYRASAGDAKWLQRVLDTVSRPFGIGIDLDSDGLLTFHPKRGTTS